MKVISRKTAAVVAAAVVLGSGGVAYAASSTPSNQDAQNAVKVLQDYVNAQATAEPSTVTVTAPPSTVTQTVTETATKTVTETVTAPPVTTTVTVTASPTTSPTTTTPTPTTTTPTPTTTTPTPTTTSPSPSGPSFAPTTLWTWADGPSLGCTPSGDQWASATVAGLSSRDYNAGFRLRFTNTAQSLYAGINGNTWQIESPAIGQATGAISAPANGSTLRVALTGTTLTISVNGTVVHTRTISESLAGRQIVPSVWQPTAAVKMTNIQSSAGSCTTPTPTTTSPTPTTTTPTPTTTSASPSTTPPAGAEWLSGASSVYAVDGTYGSWRGEPVTVVGTWSDGDPAGSQSVGSMGPGTDMAGLNSSFALDIAVGAIWQGQTWSQAATGAYNAGWLKTLQTLKQKAADVGVKPQNIYIRFAHEYNGDWFDWKVAKGQEANFRNAIARFSTLRYDVFGTTNAPKVVLCSNEGTSGGMADPRDEFVKNDGLGRPVVDVYCTDFYNAWPFRTDATQIRNWLNRIDGGIPDSPEEHRRFAESQGVPFSVGEWSNCGVASQCSDGGGESPAFMDEVNRWFREHAGSLTSPAAGQLLYEVQFNLWSQYAIYGPEAHQPQTSAEYARLVWGQ